MLNRFELGIFEFEQYADAFSDAAYKLAVAKFQEPGYQDFKSLPIVFLFRHALELYMKGVIVYGKMIINLSKIEKFELNHILSTHDLKKLLPDFKQSILDQNWEWPPIVNYENEIVSLDQMIDEIDIYDKHSYSFRYPIQKKSYTNPLNKGFQFDVYRFASIMKLICDLLSGACMGLSEEYSILCDAIDENQ